MTERTLNRYEPTFSPLEPVFEPYADTVPYALREQFYVSPDDPFDVVLKGKMHRVWYRPRWLLPLMWALGKCGILVPQQGRDIPMSLHIIARRTRSGRPIHTYARTFYFAKCPVHFNTSMVYDRALDRAADLVGPGNILFIVWRTEFRPPTVMTQDTERVALRIGKRRIWLPRPLWRWMVGVVHHSQWTDPQREDLIHVELMIWHPLVGYCFGYEGAFHLTRETRGIQASEESPLEWTQDMVECTM